MPCLVTAVLTNAGSYSLGCKALTVYGHCALPSSCIDFDGDNFRAGLALHGVDVTIEELVGCHAWPQFATNPAKSIGNYGRIAVAFDAYILG